jgi:hypothetical protein
MIFYEMLYIIWISKRKSLVLVFIRTTKMCSYGIVSNSHGTNHGQRNSIEWRERDEDTCCDSSVIHTFYNGELCNSIDSTFVWLWYTRNMIFTEDRIDLSLYEIYFMRVSNITCDAYRRVMMISK